MDRGASPFRDGKFLSAETIAKCVTPELAYIVEIERGEAKVGGSEKATPWTLRATMIFRPEEGTWKVVPTRRPHNHPTASKISDPGIALPLDRTS
jgi:ketosteroid isomerase-like protein